MKVLLTGATGYIGKRLLPILIETGYHVVCAVRDKRRFNPPQTLRDNLTILELDLLDADALRNLPKDLKAAYYLVHSMSSSSDYQELEQRSAINFREAINKTDVEQVIYLSGITNEAELSKHLNSRLTVENELEKGRYALTTLRAGIIIGSGSASFEIIRDLVEKLPIMVTPRWLKTKCQPIGIKDVLRFLKAALLNPKVYNNNFDIGGPDILSYKDMLLGFAESRKLKRLICIVPVMTPRLSSYWLYFVTSTSYKLAISLVNSMKVEVVCRNHDINTLLDINPSSYKDALAMAFSKIKSNAIVSSWKDSYASSNISFNISEFIEVPTFGCFKDQRLQEFTHRDRVLSKIWSIGGENGWYYGDRLWQLRGFLDKLVGGVGLRRGRTSSTSINVGDSLDFWRVIYACPKEGRLLLFAEMKLPGEAWLEFKIKGNQLQQTATFRPRGLWGRLYWFAVLPFHGFIFNGMLKKLTN